jgi:hypothetical protein
VSRLRVEQRENDLHPSRECGYEVGTLGSDEHGKQYTLGDSPMNVNYAVSTFAEKMGATYRDLTLSFANHF